MFKRTFHVVNREKDLRRTFDDFILGKSGGIKHAHKVLIRRARLDKNDKVLKCKCVDFLTDEAVVESSGPVRIKSDTLVYLGAPITGPDSGPILCAGSIEPFTGLPFAVWGLGAKNHIVGS